MSVFDDLAAPFPPTAIHWRQGGKGKYLAYIDARDVMDRLDSVVGPENWKTEWAETPSGRIVYKLSVRVPTMHYELGEWITKSDGAGMTAFEGEKGAISDALKRTAVLFGVGRYLYDLPIVDSPAMGKEILLSRYNVMTEEAATELSQLLDAADPESGDGVCAFGEAWLELNQDEQMGFAPWITKFYPGGVTKTKEHMRNVMAAYRAINGGNDGATNQ